MHVSKLTKTPLCLVVEYDQNDMYRCYNGAICVVDMVDQKCVTLVTAGALFHWNAQDTYFVNLGTTSLNHMLLNHISTSSATDKK